MSSLRLTEILWSADKFLVVVALLSSLSLLIYSISRNILNKRRNLALLKIKKNIHGLAGTKNPNTCSTVRINNTEEFLDISMNRDTVLFNDDERAYIKECFARTGNLDHIRRIALRSHDKWRRIEAILSLGYAQDQGSLPILEGSLLDNDNDVSYFSMISLASIKNRDSAGILLAYLKASKVYTQTILSLLEKFGPDIDDDIVKLLSSEDPRIRYMAVRLIAARSMRYASQDVKRLLSDASADVRSVACDCIGRLVDTTAKDELKMRLGDGAWFVKMNAVRALSRIFGKEAMPDIIPLLDDPSILVKESVKTAVINNPEAAIPYIGKILENGDPISKQEIIEALEASGYLKKILDDIAYKGSKEQDLAFGLLKNMLDASVRFGVGSAAERYDRTGRTRILAAIKRINPELAGKIEQNWRTRGVEIG